MVGRRLSHETQLVAHETTWVCRGWIRIRKAPSDRSRSSCHRANQHPIAHAPQNLTDPGSWNALFRRSPLPVALIGNGTGHFLAHLQWQRYLLGCRAAFATSALTTSVGFGAGTGRAGSTAWACLGDSCAAFFFSMMSKSSIRSAWASTPTRPSLSGASPLPSRCVPAWPPRGRSPGPRR